MLAKRGLLVSLDLGLFDPQRKDKGLTKEFAQSKNADPDAVRVSKRLLPEQAALPIKQYHKLVREFFRKNTSPFAEGLALLDIRNYEAFWGTGSNGAEGIRQMKTHVQKLVDEWAVQYPTACPR